MTSEREKIKDAVYTQRCVYSTHYHLIWCTKYRHPIFQNEILKTSLEKMLYQIAKDNEIVIKNLQIMNDHIHLLISFSPSKSASSVIKAFKGRSGFLLLKTYPQLRKAKFWGGHLWSPSYYFGTVGNMSKQTVDKYINDQVLNKTKSK